MQHFKLESKFENHHRANMFLDITAYKLMIKLYYILNKIVYALIHAIFNEQAS